MQHQKLLIVDFGSQYTQLIARRVREAHVYCEIHPFNKLPELKGFQAVILSGSPYSVHQKGAPKVNFKAFENMPLLGICYGAQLLTHEYGGVVDRAQTREYGPSRLVIKQEDPLWKGVKDGQVVWMSHADTISQPAHGAEIIAATQDIPIAAFRMGRSWYGLQFHPEVVHSVPGKKIIRNFLKMARFRGDWTPANFIQETVENLRSELGQDNVVMALSGGVDSTVAALLLHRAIGHRLHGIFVDNGLLRLNEYEEVLDSYKYLGLNVRGVKAGGKFLKALRGVDSPEKKRKIIGRVFIEVFQNEAQRIRNVRWLAQGTIYPDVIESVSVKGPSATIKSHHNVGGLPQKMKLQIVEPLRMLFKDEVRQVGRELGLSESFLKRHPFPGPGLGIRVLGEVTPKKLRILREADYIFISALKAEGYYDQVWQAGAVFLPVKSVGVMGDERTYAHVIALRAVTSLDGMTADWAYLPHDFLARVSTEIINKVKGVNRVVYDISTKPPATIEWE
ncbi:MAG: glutamine-hydrolyzing GMP synthase [Flavobacteriales bacterium]|nr:glutamine-hydrolyzing GMP synthase [Flavobacteriales bacterium]MCX7769052.1 glutamine-hydrolyzing GMP synthase [Flavobacteriales bacterium]MDW8410327.1 glutamine-hydrolyzing GMP synthase [Flavobacteriales bacterium]